MSPDWLNWSSPVAIWWCCLAVVSAVNIALWLKLHAYSSTTAIRSSAGLLTVEPLVLLAAAYVFGCAFRSILPRADVQRICLFDTWLSSVMVGRSVATVAELCFAAQWAIVLREFGKISHSDTTKNIANAILPLIVLAECCSWFAVISTDFLGNVLENSVWTVTFSLIAVALLRLLSSFRGPIQIAIAAAAAGVACYIVFMSTIDVPMYYARWQADLADGKPLLGVFSGLYDLATRWVVTRDITPWQNEMAWMSLYFSAAVWASLALCVFYARM